MAVAKTIRISEEVNSMADEFARKNGLKFNQVVSLALEKYVGEQNTVELEPINKKKWEEASNDTFSKHKKTIDDLK